MCKKTILLIILFLIGSLLFDTDNSLAQNQPNFRDPTGYRHYTGSFGEERTDRQGRPYRHTGLDIVGPTPGVINGADVTPSANGRVSETGTEGRGTYAIIDHGNGWETHYYHLQRNSLSVRRDQQVTTETIIGRVGSTGRSDAPHLHLEIRRNGVPVNPQDLLPGRYNQRRPGTGGGPVPDTHPAQRPPDDTFSVADATFPTIPNLEDAYYRLAGKKGKAVVINYYFFKTLIKERDAYLENLPDGSIPDRAYLDSLEAEVSQLHESFGPNQEIFWKEYLETPDVAVLQRGYPDGVESLLGRFQEPVTEIWIDFAPQEVIKHHPVLLIPSGGLYGLQADNEGGGDVVKSIKILDKFI